MTTNDHETVSTFVPVAFDRLDEFLADPGGLAMLLPPDVERADPCQRNDQGVHDHALHGADGTTEHVAMRLLRAGDGCIVVMTFQGPGIGGARPARRAGAASVSLAALRNLCARGLPPRDGRPRKAMTPDELRETLVTIVSCTTGIKAVEAAAALAAYCIEKGYEIPSGDVTGALSDLVREGRVVEVEYTVPETPGRVKSFLLPAGSRARPVAA